MWKSYLLSLPSSKNIHSQTHTKPAAPLGGSQKIKLLLRESKMAVNQTIVELNNLPNSIVYFKFLYV